LIVKQQSAPKLFPVVAELPIVLLAGATIVT
jgi:hypothetical protein